MIRQSTLATNNKHLPLEDTDQCKMSAAAAKHQSTGLSPINTIALASLEEMGFTTTTTTTATTATTTTTYSYRPESSERYTNIRVSRVSLNCCSCCVHSGGIDSK